MKSMTAYAYSKASGKRQSVEIVAKSLNSKYLDINIHHLPLEKVMLERQIRKIVEEKISRGRVELYVSVNAPLNEKAEINKKLLSDYLRQIRNISKTLGIDPRVSVKDLLHLPGLISVNSKKKISDDLILRTAKGAVDKIVAFRSKEGRAIKESVIKHTQQLKKTIEKIQTVKPRATERELGKEDIEEEVALISFYVKKLVRLIHRKGNSPRGKAIDFLAQEILKELNTCASKTKKVELASLIIESKNYSERIREQAQNIE
jgi:uncharacterized protein (TIGR00255 family)